MMKRSLVAFAALIAIAIVAPLTTAGEEKPFFDLENCAICKNLGAEEGLMDHIDWETHLLDNGALTVSYVPEEYKAAMARAHGKMMAVVQKMESGESVHLCGFCTSYGALMTSGAQIKEFETKTGSISLMTSTDAKVVEMIHAHSNKTEEEYEVWKKEQAEQMASK